MQNLSFVKYFLIMNDKKKANDLLVLVVVFFRIFKYLHNK